MCAEIKGWGLRYGDFVGHVGGIEVAWVLAAVDAYCVGAAINA